MKIPPSVFKDRIRKVEGRMQDEKLDALIVYSVGTALGFNNQVHGYMRYLTDFNAQNSAAVLILVPGREPILFVTIIYLYHYAKETLWFQDIRYVEPRNLGEEIAKALQHVELPNQRIGYIGRAETPTGVYESLLQSLDGGELVEANRLIDELTLVKEDLEIVLERRAAEVCDKMLETLTREIRKGKRVYQLQADMDRTARYEGCEFASCWLAVVGPVADRPRYYKDECSRVPQVGDQVMVGLYAIYEGYWGHAIREGAVGEPSDAHKEVFDVALEMADAALEKLKPGLNLMDVQGACDAVHRKHYPDLIDDPAINGVRARTAHFLGLEYEHPMITDAFPQPYLPKPQWKEGETPFMRIEPGMIFELHPNIYVPDVGWGIIGDMVLITETGNEILTRFPRQLIEW